MMTGRGRPSFAAGGLARHIPVLLSKALAALSPRDGDIILDGTFGAGGYARAILEAADCQLIAIDRDPSALRLSADLTEAFPERFRAVLGRYGDMEDLLAEKCVHALDGVVLDLGVSSMQLDEPERGFSFAKDGPLDMRMGNEGLSAADLVNGLDEAELANIIYVFGEERRSRAIAKAIVRTRAEAPISSTLGLAEIVANTIGRKRDDTKHPATRTFQALRLAVNGELDELGRGLSAAESLLKPGGRLVVVTFHSLEDRIVKRFLGARSAAGPKGSRHMPFSESKVFFPSFQLLNRRPLEPSREEIRSNPRARSARLRAALRTEGPSHALDLATLGVPRGIEELRLAGKAGVKRGSKRKP